MGLQIHTQPSLLPCHPPFPSVQYLAAVRSEGTRNGKKDTLLARKQVLHVHLVGRRPLVDADGRQRVADLHRQGQKRWCCMHTAHESSSPTFRGILRIAVTEKLLLSTRGTNKLKRHKYSMACTGQSSGTSDPPGSGTFSRSRMGIKWYSVRTNTG